MAEPLHQAEGLKLLGRVRADEVDDFERALNAARGFGEPNFPEPASAEEIDQLIPGNRFLADIPPRHPQPSGRTLLL